MVPKQQSCEHLWSPFAKLDWSTGLHKRRCIFCALALCLNPQQWAEVEAKRTNYGS